MAKTTAPYLVRIKSYSKNNNLPFILNRTIDWNVEKRRSTFQRRSTCFKPCFSHSHEIVTELTNNQTPDWRFSHYFAAKTIRTKTIKNNVKTSGIDANFSQLQAFCPFPRHLLRILSRSLQVSLPELLD
jgi:hypothetical protein